MLVANCQLILLKLYTVLSMLLPCVTINSSRCSCNYFLEPMIFFRWLFKNHINVSTCILQGPKPGFSSIIWIQAQKFSHIPYGNLSLPFVLQICCAELQTVMVPLPDCASGEWGPTKATRLFGLVPITHQV